MEADPDGAERRAAAAGQERFVRLGRTSEHGLKLIIARATAGNALCFKAIIDRLAAILANQGDSDTVDTRRSKAIGILAQPAEALKLLCEHQDDAWDGPPEPDDPEPDDPEPDPADPARAEEREHSSVTITPPPFDPKRARPRVVIYVHLSEEALRAGRGVARVEEVGPMLLGQLGAVLRDRCTINLKPVIDLPAGHTPVDSYEIPASLREQILLRCPADLFPYAAALSRRIDVDHTIPYLSPDRGGAPGQTRIGNLGPNARRSHNLKTHGRWRPTTRTRHLALAITPPTHVPRQRGRHSRARAHRGRSDDLARRPDSARRPCGGHRQRRPQSPVRSRQRSHRGVPEPLHRR